MHRKTAEGRREKAEKRRQKGEGRREKAEKRRQEGEGRREEKGGAEGSLHAAGQTWH